jgi:hypothetical protein
VLCCRYLVPCSFLLNTSGAAAAPPEPVNHADAGPHVSQRKTAQQRLFWAQILPARMKEPEIRALHNSMQLPPPVGEARPKPAWPNKARMREILHGIPEEPWGESVPEPASKSLAGAHRRNVKDAAKRAYEDMLWQGSTAPRQSVLKGTKALRTNRGDKLDAVADIIRGGVVECDGKESAACEWPTADGAAPCPPMKRIFYSFTDAKALSPKMEQLFREIGVQETHLHRLLRERFPTYRPNLKITVKPERDCAKVQAAAAVSTAAVPVPTPSFVKDPKHLWPKMIELLEHWWDERLYREAWFVDCGTIDMTQIKLKKKGLGFIGGNNPPLVCCPFLAAPCSAGRCCPLCPAASSRRLRYVQHEALWSCASVLGQLT